MLLLLGGKSMLAPEVRGAKLIINRRYQCWKPIGGEYYEYRGGYQCRLHHFQRVGHCGRCGLAVEENCREVTLRLGGKTKFHAEHFRADCCGVVFGLGDRFHEHKGAFYCDDHFCAHCGEPISTDDLGRISGSASGDSLHSWCHQMRLTGPE